ncbi:MAG: type II secretion system minor pseudopilin GspK [Pseudomonas sp.]|nr:type II secretion system minor pseudopilin GspK [Pseudomonas sp.]MDZ4190967.1 type II secretion system minor pseudopilin GspK [Pseudomonas sp.]
MKRVAQRGTAIISALLVATVVSVIVAAMLGRQTQTIRSVEGESQRAQGAWLSRGVLEWAKQTLWQQRLDDPMTRRDQLWAQPVRAVRLGGAEFEGSLSDEQGKFNLRNLVQDGLTDDLEVAAFERLCAHLSVPQGQIGRIVQRVIDAYPRRTGPVLEPSGNEFDSGRLTSLSAHAQVMPARRPMLRHVDDLASVPGLAPETLERLRPFVTVLPAATWVNGNTASAQVLASRVPGMAMEQAQAIVAERDRGQWFINSGDYLNRLRLPQMTTEQLRLGITSEWFLLQGLSTVAQRKIPVEALLFRADVARPRVVWSRVGA